MTAIETQRVRILHWLQAGNSITDAEARDLFGCARLGARIWDLKKAGYPIQSAFEYKYDKGRVVKKWKRYWLPTQ